MRNVEKRKEFCMEKDCFSMKINFSANKLTSPVAMEQPINTGNFVEFSGNSEFTRIYAGNTFRTVAVHPEKKSELTIDDAIKTVTWDFFKNNGDFIAQIILFVSTEQYQNIPIKKLETLEKVIATITTPILRDYIEGNSEDLEQRFRKEFNTKITPEFVTLQNITCVLTTVKPENIKNTNISLPKNCDVFLEDEKVSFTALRSGTDQCYVVTKDTLFHYKKVNQDTTSRQEIKLTKTSKLIEAAFPKLRDKLSTLKSNQSVDGFFPQEKQEKHDSALRTVMNFLPQQDQPVKLVTNNNSGKSAYTTLVINHGDHVVRIIDSKGTSRKLEALTTIEHLQQDEIVQIESQPGLLNIDKQEIKENKENKYDRPPYFKAVGENLCAQAEALRKKAYGYWEVPTAKTWLLLISRLWAFQNRLESGYLRKPEDPTYQLLRTASLTDLWPLTKALQNIQTLEKDAKKISEDDLGEIKKQWQAASTTENKSQPLTWQQAFKTRHPEAPIEIGGEVRILAVMPINHAHKIRNFTALPISIPKLPIQLKCVEHHFLKGPNRIILSLLPPASQTPSTLDAIREFYCYNASRPLAKLTVLYSPRYIEGPGWQRDMQEVRDQVLKSLALQIFTNLDKFDSDSFSFEDMRDFVSTILSREPFKDVKANLLFCLYVTSKGTGYRYLFGVGNCMALTSTHNSVNSNGIGALYDSEKDVPVLLNSLNRPDDPSKLISGSGIRQSESVQIAGFIAPLDEILLCSGRLISLDLLNEKAVTSKFKFRNFELNIEKLLSQNKGEIKTEKLIGQVTQALQINRRKFLDIIENPHMVSAWKKLEHRLRTTSRLLDDEEDGNIGYEKAKINSSTGVDDFVQNFNSLTLKKITSESRLSDDEAEMIRELWKIALIEGPNLRGYQTIHNWDDIRRKYFIYFEGIKDLMAVFSPDMHFTKFRLAQHINSLAEQAKKDITASFLPNSHFTKFPLGQHIHGFAEQYLLPSQQARKEQILEIEAFSHAICSMETDKQIYIIIYQKLKFIEWQRQGSLEPGFWKDLVKVLIVMFINVDPNIEHEFDPEDFDLSVVLNILDKMSKPATTTGPVSSFTSFPPPPRRESEDNKTGSKLRSLLSTDKEQKKQEQVRTPTLG